MRRLIATIEKRLVRGYEFVGNVTYYYGLGYALRKSIQLARRTLP